MLQLVRVFLDALFWYITINYTQTLVWNIVPPNDIIHTHDTMLDIPGTTLLPIVCAFNLQ